METNISNLIQHYKNSNPGIQQACFFLKDLEPELEKLSQSQPTDYCYYNIVTEKKYYFSVQNVYQVRTKIDNLLLEYYVMKPELLKLEECHEFDNLVVVGIQWYDLTKSSMLNFLLSFRSDSEQKKLDILVRLFLLTEHKETFNISYNEFVNAYGEKILDFCIFRFWDQRSEKDNLAILDFFGCKTKQQLYEKNNLGAHLAKPIVDHLLKVNEKNFYLLDNKIKQNFGVNIDYSKDLEIPRVFSTKKTNCYAIDLEKFYFFLEDLDDYRIHFNLKELNSVLWIENLQEFEQMCLKYGSPKIFEKIRAYCCDFSSKKLQRLEEFDLKSTDTSKFHFKLHDIIINIHLAKLNLQTELFSNYVLSCFNNFECNNENFYEIPHRSGYVNKKK